MTARWVGLGLIVAALVVGALLVLRPGDPPTLAE
jgi:hypothetical protein